MLGHLRHEVGHLYWTVLVEPTPRLDAFRELFGDERADYATALERHDDAADDRSWTDTTSVTTRLRTRGRTGPSRSRTTCTSATRCRPHTPGGSTSAGPRSTSTSRGTPGSRSTRWTWRATSTEWPAAWIAFTFAMNAVNDSMGTGPLYPFALTPTVLQKLHFVHDAIGSAVGTRAGATT